MGEFLSKPQEPYLVEPVHGANGHHDFLHTFCGRHEIPGTMCPNCHKPMLRFLTLDARDPRLELGEAAFPMLSLVWCWTCNVAQRELYYRIQDDGGIRLLTFGVGGVQDDFPYENYPAFFPGKQVELRSPTPEEGKAMAAINSPDSPGWHEAMKKWPALDRARHQVGGEPYFMGNERAMVCPDCGEEMPFLASIGDNSGTPRGFVENGWVQVLYHYCRACRVVGVYQETD